MSVNNIFKIIIVGFLSFFSSIGYSQDVIVDSLGLIWKVKIGTDSLYEFQGINEIDKNQIRSVKYNLIEKYFLDFISARPKRKKIENNHNDWISFVQEKRGIAIEIKFHNANDLILHYYSIIDDINSKINGEQNQFILGDGNNALGHGLSWSGGVLGDKELVVFIKLSLGVVPKSDIANYSILKSVLRLEYSK